MTIDWYLYNNILLPVLFIFSCSATRSVAETLDNSKYQTIISKCLNKEGGFLNKEVHISVESVYGMCTKHFKPMPWRWGNVSTVIVSSLLNARCGLLLNVQTVLRVYFIHVRSLCGDKTWLCGMKNQWIQFQFPTASGTCRRFQANWTRLIISGFLNISFTLYINHMYIPIHIFIFILNITTFTCLRYYYFKNTLILFN